MRGHCVGQRATAGVDYSYVDVYNRFAADPDEQLGRLSVWSVDAPAHLPLLSTVLPAQQGPDALFVAFQSTVCVVAVALDDPASVEPGAEAWLAQLAQALAALQATLSDAQRAALARAVSRRVADYSDPSLRAADAVSDSVLQAAAAGGAGSGDVAGYVAGLDVDAHSPAVNLGVPVVIAATGIGAFARAMASADSGGVSAVGAPDAGGQRARGSALFASVVRRLRRVALRYGATLWFAADSAAPAAVATAASTASSSSSAAAAAGGSAAAAAPLTAAQTLQDWLYHALFKWAVTRPARTHGTPHDPAVYVPAGADSAALLSGETGPTSSATSSFATRLDEVPLTALLAGAAGDWTGAVDELRGKVVTAFTPEAFRAAAAAAQSGSGAGAGTRGGIFAAGDVASAGKPAPASKEAFDAVASPSPSPPGSRAASPARSGARPSSAGTDSAAVTAATAAAGKVVPAAAAAAGGKPAGAAAAAPGGKSAHDYFQSLLAKKGGAAGAAKKSSSSAAGPAAGVAPGKGEGERGS